MKTADKSFSSKAMKVLLSIALVIGLAPAISPAKAYAAGVTTAVTAADQKVSTSESSTIRTVADLQSADTAAALANDKITVSAGALIAPTYTPDGATKSESGFYLALTLTGEPGVALAANGSSVTIPATGMAQTIIIPLSKKDCTGKTFGATLTQNGVAADISIVIGDAVTIPQAFDASCSANVVYNGANQAPTLTVTNTLTGKPLTLTTDYAVAWIGPDGKDIADPAAADAFKNAGVYKATVSGITDTSYVNQTKMLEYTIAKAKLADVAEIVLADANKPILSADTAVGALAKVKVTGKAGVEASLTTELEKKANFTLSSVNLTTTAFDVKGVLTSAGMKNFEGELAQSFSVVSAPISIESAAVTYADGELYYNNGNNVEPHPTVILDGITLTEGRDFTVAWEGARAAVGAQATITIKGIGAYTGTPTTAGSGTYTIAAANLSKIKASDIVVTAPASMEWTGSAIALTAKDVTVSYKGKTLALTTDFAAALKEATKVGKTTLTITGEANFTGSIAKDFEITARDISKATVTGLEDKEYTGAIITVTPVLKWIDKAQTRIDNAQYYDAVCTNAKGEVVGFDAIKEAGTYTATFVGKDGYAGSKLVKTFAIGKGSITADMVKVTANLQYTGTPLSAPAVAVAKGSDTLVVDKDYKLTFAKADGTAIASDKIVDAGTYLAIVTPQGNYSGTPVKKSFVVAQKPLNEDMITFVDNIATFPYTGEAITPQPIVTDLAATGILKEGVDYKVIGYADNTAVGKAKAKVTVQGMGNYSNAGVYQTFDITKKNLTNADVTITGVPTQLSYTGETFDRSDIKVAINGTSTVLAGADLNITIGTVAAPGTDVQGPFLAGNHKVTVALANTNANYAGTFAQTDLNVAKADLAKAKITNLGSCTVKADGTAVMPAYTTNAGVDGNYFVTLDGAKNPLRVASLSITATNNTEIGKATLNIAPAVSASQNIAGSLSTNYAIVDAKTLTIDKVSVASATYNGSALTPTVTLAAPFDTGLIEDVDYTIAYADNTNAGFMSASAIVTGISAKCKGKVTKNFTIGAMDLGAATLTAKFADQTYTGKALTPIVEKMVVTLPNLTELNLVEGTDYTLTATANTNAGTAIVTVAGKGNYTNTKAAGGFTIDPIDLSKATVVITTDDTVTPKPIKTGDINTYLYTGSEVKPVIKSVVVNGVTLALTTDYTETYKNNTNVGTAQIVVAGVNDGNYSKDLKVATKDFKIIKANDLSLATATAQDVVYTGKAVAPVTSVVAYDGKTLNPLTDYRVSYKDADGKTVAAADLIKVGKYSATITGSGIYTGVTEANFSIVATDIATATIAPIADQAYTGKAIEPAVVVTLGDKILVAGTDYTVAYANNTEKGVASVTITGAGIYTGTKTANFNIVDKVTYNQLAGTDLFDTMQAIQEKAFTANSCDTVILSTQTGFADALGASGLAGALKAKTGVDVPVLITAKEELTAQTAATIQYLGAQNVIITGGEAVVSAAVADALTASGLTVTRTFGQTATDTAVAVNAQAAKDGTVATTAVLATSKNFADALAVAPYAYALGAPIYLTEVDGSLSEATATALKDFADVRIVGGTAVIPQATQDALVAQGSSVVRWSGDSLYETSAKIAQEAVSEGVLAFNEINVATGKNYFDALSASAAAGSKKSVLLLVDEGDWGSFVIGDTITKNKDTIQVVNFLGGDVVVTPATQEAIKAALA